MAKHICPVWVGYLMASPLRRLLQNPETMLKPYVEPGMTVLDIGSAMGFFSLPLARMVGSSGHVVSIDVQEPMIRALDRRLAKAKLTARVETRLCDPDHLGIHDLAGSVDLALAFYVVHEAASPSRLLSEIHAALKPGGRLLLSEPRGHVSSSEFEEATATATGAGFSVVDRPSLRRSYTALFEKGAG